jgi:hypothetical protein
MRAQLTAVQVLHQADYLAIKGRFIRLEPLNAIFEAIATTHFQAFNIPKQSGAGR